MAASTTDVSIEIEAPDGSFNTFDDVKDYAIKDDVIGLGDDFCLTVANPDGRHTDQILDGARCRVWMQDPRVQNGAPILQLKGVIVRQRVQVSPSGGMEILVQGADYGWHLQNNDGPPLFNMEGVTLDYFLQHVIDPSWDFGPAILTDNEENRKLNQGRLGLTRVIQKAARAILPPIQIEPGQNIAQILIEYAKREQLLVNVTSDGSLALFRPNYGQPISCSFDFHPSTSDERVRNNVKMPVLDRSIEGLYTDVSCFTTRVRPDRTQDTHNFNEGRIRGDYQNLDTLPFRRRRTFTDQEQIGQAKADARARWMYLRGLHDSWTLTFTVAGHVQNGLYYAADTMCDLRMPAFGVERSGYITSVQKCRKMARGIDASPETGTFSRIAVHLPGVLAA